MLRYGLPEAINGSLRIYGEVSSNSVHCQTTVSDNGWLPCGLPWAALEFPFLLRLFLVFLAPLTNYA